MENHSPLTSPAASQPPTFPQQRTSGMAITSMILGISSVLGGALLLIPPVLAVIFGHISLSKCKKDPALGGRGMGIAGLVMGYVAIVPALLFTLGLFSAMAIPAFSKVREASQEKMILNNLRQLSAAADQYFLEHGANSATINDLVGEQKYVRELNTVSGETYPTIYLLDQPIIVTLPNGTTLSYP
jgi:type IV pilus assembly protein PilA